MRDLENKIGILEKRIADLEVQVQSQHNSLEKMANDIKESVNISTSMFENALNALKQELEKLVPNKGK